ncbi:MAG: DUF4411 family protein [Phycisphaeraceae bacterium]|nr:DUF4411 family protein [Phycisphaeraceae bacterium]
MAYLIDSDILIAAKNLHYGMDFCPAFWDWLAQANQDGKLLSIEAVREDMTVGNDDLAEWVKARHNGFFEALPVLAQVELKKRGHVCLIWSCDTSEEIRPCPRVCCTTPGDCVATGAAGPNTSNRGSA